MLLWTWKLNVAHNFFIQDKPHLYKEAIKYYEPIVKKNSDNVCYLILFVLLLYCTHSHLIDFECDCHCISQSLCGLYYDESKRGC